MMDPLAKFAAAINQLAANISAAVSKVAAAAAKIAASVNGAIAKGLSAVLLAAVIVLSAAAVGIAKTLSAAFLAAVIVASAAAVRIAKLLSAAFLGAVIVASAAVLKAVRNFDGTFGPPIRSVAHTLKGFLTMLKGLKEYLSSHQVLDALKNYLKKMEKDLLDYAKGWLKKEEKDLLDQAERWLDKHGGKLLAKMIGDALVAVLEDILNLLVDLLSIQLAAEFGYAFMYLVFTPSRKLVYDIFGKAGARIYSAGIRFRDSVWDGARKIGTATRKFTVAILDGANRIWNAGRDFLTRVLTGSESFNSAWGRFTRSWDKASGDIGAAGEKFKNSLKDAWDDVADSFSDLIRKIKEVLHIDFGGGGHHGSFLGIKWHDGGGVFAHDGRRWGTGGASQVNEFLSRLLGLLPDEYPAVLQTGEITLPRDLTTSIVNGSFGRQMAEMINARMRFAVPTAALGMAGALGGPPVVQYHFHGSIFAKDLQNVIDENMAEINRRSGMRSRINTNAGIRTK